MRSKVNRQTRFGDFRFPRARNLRALRVNRLEAKPSPRAQVPPDAQERVPPVGGRSDATRRGRRRYRARHPICHSEAKSHNSRSRIRFHCVIKSLHRIYSITHEEAETKSNYSSYKKWISSINPSTECAISRRNGSDVKSRTFRKMGRECGNTDGM